MNTHPIWGKTLGIADKDLQTWSHALPKGISLTYWCLENGKIPADAYLEWARNHFGLPSLQKTFFAQQVNRQFWTQIQSVTNWTKEMVPLCEWDGVIFVGCVEPPTELNWSFPVRYVLADASDLNMYWKNLNAPAEMTFDQMPPTPDKQAAPVVTAPTAVPVAPPAAAPKAPETTSVLQTDDIPTTFGEMPVETPAQEAQAPAAPAPMTPPPPPVEVAQDAAPEGIKLNLNLNTSTAKVFDPMEELRKQMGMSDEPQAEAQAPTTPTAPIDDHAPEGFAKMATPPAASAEADMSAAPEGFALTFKQQPAVEKPSFLKQPTPPPTAAPVAPPTSAATDAPKDEEVITSSQEFAIPVANTNPSEFKAPDDVTKVTTTHTHFVGQFKPEFLGGMIIAVENDTILPLAWDEAFKRNPSLPASRYTLNEPSAFRIAYRTKMPYLGRVVDTAQNKKFFNDFGFEEMPPNILIQPIQFDKSVKYLLLVLTDTAKKNHQLLSAAQQLEKRFLETMNENKSAA